MLRLGAPRTPDRTTGLRKTSIAHALQPLAQKFDSHVALDPEDQAVLLSLSSRTREIPAGNYVVREFEKPNGCQVLLEGFAIRAKLSAVGSRQIIAVQLPGDALDLQHLYLDVADHNVIALTKVTVAEVGRNELKALLERRINLMRAFIVENAVEASISREWLLNIGRRSGIERIAHLICEVAIRLERQQVADMYGYVLPMTQEQLGDATGLTAVHVNRMLKNLEKEGLIARNRNKITITDWTGLSSLSAFDPTYLHLDRQSLR
ncbi:MAG: Crp/Fnr family transcriptional regulator [Oxalobacteraceae bacterium]|nr:MAG: Crp/Fnr family transcriptional regulator [Oxalobacteraceae bacterium]